MVFFFDVQEIIVILDNVLQWNVIFLLIGVRVRAKVEMGKDVEYFQVRVYMYIEIGNGFFGIIYVEYFLDGFRIF